MEPVKWPLAKYARWDEGEWKLMLPDDGQPLFLLLQNLQLFVILGKTATESVCLTQSKPNIKCSYNNGTLVISVMSQLFQLVKWMPFFNALKDNIEYENTTYDIHRLNIHHAIIWTVPHDVGIETTAHIDLKSFELSMKLYNNRISFLGKALPYRIQPHNIHIDKLVLDVSSKFRVLFSSHFDGEKCVYELKKYIDVWVAEGSRPVLDKSQETYSTVLAKILKKQNHLLPVPQSIPDEYPLEDAITLCILDPGFPALVEKVQNIIKSSENKSNQ